MVDSVARMLPQCDVKRASGIPIADAVPLAWPACSPRRRMTIESSGERTPDQIVAAKMAHPNTHSISDVPTLTVIPTLARLQVESLDDCEL